MKFFNRKPKIKIEPVKGRICTLSQIGSRLSIAKLHVKKLLECFSEDNESHHVFYLVDTSNVVIADYLSELNSNPKITVYTRDDNKVTDFRRLKKSAPFGGDTNYEFLITRPEVGEFFLTLHDDSMLLGSGVPDMLRHYAKHYEFIGYLDSRKEITSYDNLLIDGIPLSSLRMGTWFTFGNSKIFLDSYYKMGMYRTVNMSDLRKEFKDISRLKLLTDDIWLNGGMPFNIQMRLDNRKILMLDNFPKSYAEHLTKVTGFFAARGLMAYVDKPEEVDIWRERFVELHKIDAPPGTLYRDPYFDKDFLLKLAMKLESEGIHDALVNTDTIKKISAKVN